MVHRFTNITEGILERQTVCELCGYKGKCTIHAIMITS